MCCTLCVCMENRCFFTCFHPMLLRLAPMLSIVLNNAHHSPASVILVIVIGSIIKHSDMRIERSKKNRLHLSMQTVLMTICD